MSLEQELREKIVRLEAALRYIARLAHRQGEEMIEQIAQDALIDVED